MIDPNCKFSDASSSFWRSRGRRKRDLFFPETRVYEPISRNNVFVIFSNKWGTSTHSSVKHKMPFLPFASHGHLPTSLFSLVYEHNVRIKYIWRDGNVNLLETNNIYTLKKDASTSSTFIGLYLTLFFNDYCSSVNSTLLALVKWKDFDGTSSFGFSVSHIVENVLVFLGCMV